MSILLTVERTLSASPAAAFALGLDPQRFPDCFRGYGPIPAIRRITLHAPPAVGSTRSLENSDGSRPLERITALDPPHRHAYVLSGLRAPLSWLVREGRADWIFTPVEGGTQVRWSYDFEPTSALSKPFAAALLQMLMRPAMARCLARMDALLQREAG